MKREQREGYLVEFVPDALPPTPVAPWRSLLHSLPVWARSGFGVVGSARYLRRKAICLRCPHWQPEGWFGSGKCGLCGCSKLKLKLKGMVCPDGRWR